MAAIEKFSGFPLELMPFLQQLSKHNNKKWFDAHRDDYEAVMRQPALDFIEAMQKPLSKVSPHVLAAPKKVGGSLLRINRDIRFSKDKTPYKTHLGIQFRHEQGKDIHAPGYYLHVDLEQAFLGAGVWHPDSASLQQIRAAIDEEPQRWKKITSAKRFTDRFRFGGDSLKRPPKGYQADHPWIDDLKRKDFIVLSDLSHDDLFSPDAVKVVTDHCKRAAPFMQFLCQAIGVEF